jgi:hypothetical protein
MTSHWNWCTLSAMEPGVGFTEIVQALLIVIFLALWVWFCVMSRRRLREDWEREHPDFETNETLVTRFTRRRPRTIEDIRNARLLQSKEEDDWRAFFQDAPADKDNADIF